MEDINIDAFSNIKNKNKKGIISVSFDFSSFLEEIDERFEKFEKKLNDKIDNFEKKLLEIEKKLDSRKILEKLEKIEELSEECNKRKAKEILEKLEKIEKKLEKNEVILEKLNKLENKIENKFVSLEERCERMFERILEKIAFYVERKLAPKLDEIKDIVENKNKEEIEDLKSELNDLRAKKEDLERENSELNFELSRLRDENKKLIQKLDDLENSKRSLIKDLDYLKSQKEKLSREKDELASQILELENSIKRLNSQLEFLENENEDLKKELFLYKEKSKDIEELAKYKEALNEPKLLKLLDSILKNEALEKFREKYEILDTSPKSIVNLLKLLKDERTFINSVYEFINEYKKIYQNEMSDNEINFYNAVNDYFKENIFFNISKKVQDEYFDKSIHRGINGETRGEFSDDKLVLIPPCKVDDRKMKVKLK